MRKCRNLLLFLFVVAIAHGEVRTWTAMSGQTIEAEYQRDTMGQVWLKMANGKQKKVPITALSKEDQDYIYRQTLPKIEITLDENISRGGRPGDIDDVVQKIQCEYQISKTSKRPYPGDLIVFYFSVSWDLAKKEFKVMEIHQKKFRLSDRNGNRYDFKGEPFELWHDPDDPPRGKKFEGMLVCIQTPDGKTVECRGRNLSKKHIKYLKKASVNDRFDSDWDKL